MAEHFFSGGLLWLFLAIVVLSNVWREVAARREAQQTIRLAIEKNYPLDAALLEKMLRTPARKSDLDRMAAGAVLMALGIGMPLLGLFVRFGGDGEALLPLMGVGAMLFLMGVALLVVSRIARQRQRTAEAEFRPR